MSPLSRSRGGPACLLVLATLLLSIFVYGTAHAQVVPDPCQSDVEVLCDNIIFVPPWGYGDSLGDLGLLITVRDDFGIPIPGIPATAFDVLDHGGGLGLHLTDASDFSSEFTDEEGRIVLTRRLQGFGHALDMPLQISVTVDATTVVLDCNSPGTANMVSPDINGDGLINITDVALFGACLAPANYCVYADFDGNGVIDLADQAIFARYQAGGPTKDGIHDDGLLAEPSKGVAKEGADLFVGCLQRDFDEDGDPNTILDSLFVMPMVPFDMKILAKDFDKLSAVELSLIAPPGVTLFPGGCLTAEAPFTVGPTGVQGCGTVELQPTSLTLGGTTCIESGPVFVATVTLWASSPMWIWTTDFLMSGELADCNARPNTAEACIGVPTPCEVSSLDIEGSTFLTCPGGDMDLDEIFTLILRDQEGAGVPGVSASEIDVLLFDERGSNEGDRFRIAALDPETNANGELHYYFEARESCRWDGCFDLLISVELGGCELSAIKRVRTLNLVRYEDDPLAMGFDEINESDELALESMVGSLDDCADFLSLYRCPLVLPQYMTMMQDHFGHSCSVTAAPDLPPSRWAAIDQNVPNPFNPRTRITVHLGHASEAATLEVYTLDGRFVKRIWEGALPEGESPFHWDGKDSQSRSVSSGVYVARLVTEHHRDSIRMVLLR